MTVQDREFTMDRRTVSEGIGRGAAHWRRPAASRRRRSPKARARTLKFVPQANLANFDPIWGTQYVVRNASALVWDTLYGVDEQAASRSGRWSRARRSPPTA